MTRKDLRKPKSNGRDPKKIKEKLRKTPEGSINKRKIRKTPEWSLPEWSMHLFMKRVV
jgi:hypothetical protein